MPNSGPTRSMVRPKVAEERRGGQAASDHVDAECAAARTDGRRRPLRRAEKVSRVRKESLSVDGEPGAARGAGEQLHAEVALQGGDALGHRLLADRQFGGGLLELARVRGGDEGAHGVEVHADRL